MKFSIEYIVVPDHPDCRAKTFDDVVNYGSDRPRAKCAACLDWLDEQNISYDRLRDDVVIAKAGAQMPGIIGSSAIIDIPDDDAAALFRLKWGEDFAVWG